LRLIALGVVVATALGLQACATPGMERPKVSKNASARMAPGQPDPALEAYRIFSENCDRQYGWPFYFNVSCRASRQPDKPSDVATSIVKALIDAGVIQKKAE